MKSSRSHTTADFIAIPLGVLPSHPFGGSDGHESHESGAARYAGCAHLNCFFVMRKKFKSARFK
jgi:hypothetical protein